MRWKKPQQNIVYTWKVLNMLMWQDRQAKGLPMGLENWKVEVLMFHGEQKIAHHNCKWKCRFAMASTMASWILKALKTLKGDSSSIQAAWKYENHEFQQKRDQLEFPRLFFLHLFFVRNHRSKFPTNIEWLWISQHVPQVPLVWFHFNHPTAIQW